MALYSRLRQHRTIRAFRLKHRCNGCEAQSALQKMLGNVGLRYPHRASGTKAPRTLRPLPLLRFAVSATGGAHLCSIQYYLRFLLSSLYFSLAASALRIMRYCPYTILRDLWTPVFKNSTHSAMFTAWSPRRSRYLSIINKSSAVPASSGWAAM